MLLPDDVFPPQHCTPGLPESCTESDAIYFIFLITIEPLSVEGTSSSIPRNAVVFKSPERAVSTLCWQPESFTPETTNHFFFPPAWKRLCRTPRPVEP